jgi:hypothetical protein
VYGHGVTETEVEEVLRGRGEDLRATGNSRRKIGQTLAGRFLQVFYVPDEDPDSVFVITAYEPQAKAKKSLPSSTTEEAEMKKQKFPPGWDEKRVKELIAHYESQTEDEEFADIEAAREAEDITLMAIPTELVPKVRALLAGE